MKKFKLIKKYADEDSDEILIATTLSTPEKGIKLSGIGKTFWYTFFIIFYLIQALTGNLKCKNNTQERHTQKL